MCNRYSSDDHDFLFLLSVRPKNIDGIKTPGVTDIFPIDFYYSQNIMRSGIISDAHVFSLHFRRGKKWSRKSKTLTNRKTSVRLIVKYFSPRLRLIYSSRMFCSYVPSQNQYVCLYNITCRFIKWLYWLLDYVSFANLVFAPNFTVLLLIPVFAGKYPNGHMRSKGTTISPPISKFHEKFKNSPQRMRSSNSEFNNLNNCWFRSM